MTRKRRQDRTTELLGELQLGRCAACGSARYGSRRQARYAARIASPGMRLRPRRCGRFWHLQAYTALTPHDRTSASLEAPRVRAIAGLDMRVEVERLYGRRRRPAGHDSRRGRARRQHSTDYADGL